MITSSSENQRPTTHHGAKRKTRFAKRYDLDYTSTTAPLYVHVEAERERCEQEGRRWEYPSFLMQIFNDAMKYRAMAKIGRKEEANTGNVVIPRMNRYHVDHFLGKNVSNAFDQELITVADIAQIHESCGAFLTDLRSNKELEERVLNYIVAASSKPTIHGEPVI